LGTRNYLCISIGRGSRIRTCGPLLPKQVLYQAELCPEPQLLGGLVTALQRSASGQEGNNRITRSLEPGIVPDCSLPANAKVRIVADLPPSVRMRRARVLPILVMPLRRAVTRLKCSHGLTRGTSSAVKVMEPRSTSFAIWSGGVRVRDMPPLSAASQPKLLAGRHSLTCSAAPSPQ